MVDSQPAIPLAAPITQEPVRPSIKTLLLRAFGLALASLILSMGVYFSSDQTGIGAGIFMLLGVGAFLVSLLAPLIVAYFVTISTAQRLQSEEFRQLSVSATSNGEIVWRCVVAALYRARILLVLVIGLMPVAVLGNAYSAVFFRAIQATVVSQTQFSAADWIATSLSNVAIAMSLWGMVLFAAALGVLLALWKHQNTRQEERSTSTLPAIRISPIVPLATLIMLGMLFWLMTNHLVVLYIGLPYVLAAAFIWLALPWARRLATGAA